MAHPTFLQTYQVPLVFLTNIVGLGFQPGYARVVLTLPPLILLVAQSALRQDSQYYGEKFPLNCMILGLVFKWIDWILLASPDKEHWHKIQYGKPPSETGVAQHKEGVRGEVPTSFLGRMWWGLRLATTERYTGWSQQVKSVRMEVPANYPRWKFILRKLLRGVLFYFLSDCVYAYTASTPHGSYRGHENGKVPVNFEGSSLSRQFVLAWVQIIITYVAMESFNTFYGVAAVALGFANPRDCPSAFGDLREMYTVRKAWGTTWHQFMRRIASAPGIFLARDVLHLRKGSFASKYLQLFVSFAVSTAIHAGSAMLSNKSFEDDSTIVVFMAQPVCILVEDHIIELGKRLGFRDAPAWRLVGYVWTVLWFGLSSRAYASAVAGRGIWVHDASMYKNVFGIAPYRLY